jgi:hypothetical protein
LNLTGTATSNLTVSYASSDTNIATIAGSTLTIVKAGTINITASQAGDATYDPATNVVQELVINKANQTITFNALSNLTYSNGGTSALTASSTSGLTITYSSSLTTIATVAGSTLTIVKAGSTVITASQAGNDNYNPATSVTQTQVIDKANQTITFAVLSNLSYSIGATSVLGAYSNSGLAITYTSSDTTVATVAGSTLSVLKVGFSDITASQAGNDNYNPAENVIRRQTIIKGNQTITFNVLQNVSYSPSGTISLSAYSSSTLSITYTSSNEEVATVAGNTLTILKVGTTTITASQLGDDNFNAAASIQRSQEIIKANQTITFNTLNNLTYAPAGTSVLSASSSSGLTISYSSATLGVATVAGNTLSIVSAGSTVITAYQAGDSNYNPATSVTQTQVIDKANQTITFNALSALTYSPSGTSVLSATSSSGLTVSYSSSNTNFATVAGNTLTIVGAGTTTITASQAGDANYNPATNVTQSQVINKANQTITFNPLSAVLFSILTSNLTATASSGLTVSYSTSDNNIATVAGNTLTFVSVGSVDVTASQAGNDNYNAATSVTKTQVINKGTQTITFDPLNNLTYSPNGTSTLTATASSNLTVSYVSSDTAVATIAGNTLTIKKAGSTTITASQAGNTNYNAATNVQQVQVIVKANQTITFGTLNNLIYSLNGTSTLTASSTSGLTISFTSSSTGVATIANNILTIISAGSTSITASQLGNENYNPASSVTQTQVIDKANQTITFNSLADLTYSPSGTSNLTASSSSGLTITYSSSVTSVATVAGSTLTIQGAGSTVITASQAGNVNYNPASSVTQTQVINKADQTITFAALANRNYSGPGYSFVVTATSNSGLTVSLASSDTNIITVTGFSLYPVGVGSSNITASQAGNANYNPAPDVVRTQIVLKGTPTFNSWATIYKTYEDANFNVTPPSSNSDGSFTYSGNNNLLATITSGGLISIVGAGSLTITATQAETSLWNSANVTTTLQIAKANQIITFNVLANQTYSPSGVTVNLSATVHTGLSISFLSSNTSVGTISGTVLTLIAAGSTNITARAAGNANYNQTDLVRTQVVDKATQTITFNALSNITYAPNYSFNLTATASSGLPISYSRNSGAIDINGSTVTVGSAGSVQITASQYGNSNYFGASNVIRTLTIDKADQTITFNALNSIPYSTLGTSTLSATATSNLTVTFTSANTSVATVSGTTLTIQGVGNTTITASQAGNINYNPATSIQQTQTITKVADPICFNEGTYILCLNKNFQEEYVLINDLRRGDVVKTYKHGYRKIEMVGKCPLVNDPNKHSCCMYKMIRNDNNGLIEDLTVTGGHAILVNNIDPYREENERLMGACQKIDDKYLLVAAASPDFVKLENTDNYTYYHFILENNGNDDERFGVWSNGILTETPSKRQFLQNNNLIIF